MQTEELLQLLDEGVVLVAADGTVRFLNDAACEQLEVRREAALGMPALAVLRDHRLEDALLSGTRLELQTRQRTLQARGFPGGLLLKDVTEARNAREEARELLAVLSHELRTPVTSITSALEALADPELPEPMRNRFQGLAAAEAQRLVRLLHDLTVDVKPPALRRVQLHEPLERAGAVLRDLLQDRGITLNHAAMPELTVFADEDKLLQVLVNLIENAAVHGPSDACITIGAEADPEANLARIWVHDEGQPLTDARLTQVFSPDSRVRASRSRGMGLGLFIVRSIAERWGGTAWGRALDAGNEFGFSVRLPPA